MLLSRGEDFKTKNFLCAERMFDHFLPAEFSYFSPFDRKLWKLFFCCCLGAAPFRFNLSPSLSFASTHSGSNCFVSSHFVYSLHYNPLRKPPKKILCLQRKLNFRSKTEDAKRQAWGKSLKFDVQVCETKQQDKTMILFMVISLTGKILCSRRIFRELANLLAIVWVKRLETTRKRERESENFPRFSVRQNQMKALRDRPRKSQNAAGRGDFIFHVNWWRTENAEREYFLLRLDEKKKKQ